MTSSFSRHDSSSDQSRAGKPRLRNSHLIVTTRKLEGIFGILKMVNLGFSRPEGFYAVPIKVLEFDQLQHNFRSGFKSFMRTNYYRSFY